MFRGLLTFAAVCSFIGTACGGVMLTTTPTERYTSHDDGFSSVVAIYGVTGDGREDILGSGVAYGLREVATAAHLPTAGYVNFRIKTGSDANNPDGVFTSSVFFDHQSYVGLSNGYDNRVFKLDSDITGVTLAEFYTGSHILGTTYDMVGFGQSGVLGGSIEFDGQRRGYQNVLRNFGPGSRVTNNFIGYRFQDVGHQDYRELGGLLWHKDSGGGWFVDGKLAALSHSTILIPATGSRSFASTLDVDWFNSHIGSSAAVPEPTSLALMGTAFGIFGLIRLRRKGKVQLDA